LSLLQKLDEQSAYDLGLLLLHRRQLSLNALIGGAYNQWRTGWKGICENSLATLQARRKQPAVRKYELLFLARTQIED
jgi:hypothetical protein